MDEPVASSESLNLNDPSATWQVISLSLESFDGYAYKMGDDMIYMPGGAEFTPHPTLGSLGYYLLVGRTQGLLYNIESSSIVSVNNEITSTLQTGVLAFGTAKYDAIDGWQCILNIGGFTQFDPLGAGGTYTNAVQYTCIGDDNTNTIINGSMPIPTNPPTLSPTQSYTTDAPNMDQNDPTISPSTSPVITDSASSNDNGSATLGSNGEYVIVIVIGAVVLCVILCIVVCVGVLYWKKLKLDSEVKMATHKESHEMKMSMHSMSDASSLGVGNVMSPQPLTMYPTVSNMSHMSQVSHMSSPSASPSVIDAQQHNVDDEKAEELFEKEGSPRGGNVEGDGAETNETLQTNGAKVVVVVAAQQQINEPGDV